MNDNDVHINICQCFSVAVFSMDVSIPVCFLLGLFCQAQSARILFHIPTPTYSHNVVYQPIIKELARRGHQIVSISTRQMPIEDKSPNITEIDVGFTESKWKAFFDGGTPNMGLRDNMRLYLKVSKLTL